jgi:hypothetical protein
MTARVTITAEFEVELDIADVFPDGTPENWSTADVLQAVRTERGVVGWIRNWCLDDDAYLTVTAEGQPSASGGFFGARP